MKISGNKLKDLHILSRLISAINSGDKKFETKLEKKIKKSENNLIYGGAAGWSYCVITKFYSFVQIPFLRKNATNADKIRNM